MKVKYLIVLPTAIVGAVVSGQAQTVFYDTVKNPITFSSLINFYADQAAASLTVPAGQIWHISNMTADLADGTVGNLNFVFTDYSSGNVVGSTAATPLTADFSLKNLDFPASIDLASGDYWVFPNLVATGADAYSFWCKSDSSFNFSLTGTLEVPEPTTFAIAGLGGGVALLMRKRK